ncbi:zinc ribbon protein [Dysgonomonas alginatilytica]|uniref:Zinc ribbon protein n=1 Tax=Dysgonomonas alginatilytica TaxID=1605892 RepID=A0A2V3PMX4_9BACT|nr:zinc ribbon domain-containing protein [Dysgonomonas alginatilytica]PXV63542.1 zinc ribbon protein [Dysgonomonas alginatilytica]
MENIKCNRCGNENRNNARYCSGCGYELPKSTIEEETSNRNVISIPVTTGRRKSINSILGVLVGLAVCFAVQHFLFKTPSFDKVMMESASEINKSCPIMVDAETRLDNAVALPKNILQYNYTLMNMDAELVDTLEMKKVLEPNIVNFVKSSPQMKVFRDNKTTINYHYKDKNGVYLFIVSVTANQYE